MANKIKIDPEELFRAGMHFGHQTFRWHPKMQPFIFGVREGVHIIDLEKTAQLLAQALEAIEDQVAKGGIILLVGTKRQAKELIAEAAEKVKMPYVNARWPGGLLTNFSTLKKRIQYLADLLSGKVEMEREHLTKKERSVLAKERERLKQNFKGLLPLKELPKMVFIVDVLKEKTALREANRLGIPLVAMVDTNVDPTPIDFVVPANDDAIQSIRLVLKLVTEAIERGQARQEKEQEGEKKEGEAKKIPSPSAGKEEKLTFLQRERKTNQQEVGQILKSNKDE